MSSFSFSQCFISSPSRLMDMYPCFLNPGAVIVNLFLQYAVSIRSNLNNGSPALKFGTPCSWCSASKFQSLPPPLFLPFFPFFDLFFIAATLFFSSSSSFVSVPIASRHLVTSRFTPSGKPSTRTFCTCFLYMKTVDQGQRRQQMSPISGSDLGAY
ncbi:hypothetical protein KC338_g201 [Hortaea werneckii]|nr:hypothetical protein KC338_g201 [Hortaea werneckii]